ncbi:MAG: hypothetical protein ACK5KN_07580 [Dysgonomonas sp.]|uniref:hypothetical protein n=1 Tax=Dysgonomonas sp. TaxID=1891233 RepID=UPI003A853C8D
MGRLNGLPRPHLPGFYTGEPYSLPGQGVHQSFLSSLPERASIWWRRPDSNRHFALLYVANPYPVTITPHALLYHSSYSPGCPSFRAVFDC